ncbi:MAG: uroporphyrinogen decarboxylase [Limibacillus sp.]|jgi:uroporphyrinogen decarboxylase
MNTPASGKDKLMLRALRGEITERPPVWLMRQAGRYLPEYRETRKQAGGFLELCYRPELAVEVTLQPIRRYGFDASILFSDILVVPHGLGQEVWFEEGEGPKLAPLERPDALDALRLEGMVERLAPVYETVRGLSAALPPETTLIGFSGAPWTLATYMLEGGTSKQFVTCKRWALAEPEAFGRLIDLLEQAVVEHLSAQVAAGAEVLQIFDSWAGALPVRALRQWSLEPLKRIVAALKARHPEVPVILFPRGAGLLYLDFAAESGAEGLSLDSNLPPAWAAEALSPQVTLQGNLDPLYLVAGGSAMDAAAEEILSAFEQRPFIFNLGHGVVPQTPPENVERLLKVIRG